MQEDHKRKEKESCVGSTNSSKAKNNCISLMTVTSQGMILTAMFSGLQETESDKLVPPAIVSSRIDSSLVIISSTNDRI